MKGIKKEINCAIKNQHLFQMKSEKNLKNLADTFVEEVGERRRNIIVNNKQLRPQSVCQRD